MKRSNKNLVSIVTAVALTTTLILNGTYSKVNAKEVSNEKLKETIVNQMKDYMKNNSKNTKGEKINSKDEEKKSQDEVVRVIVQLEEEAAINEEDSDYNETVKAEEKKVKDNQKKAIEEAKKITGEEVHRSFGYLVNGFSIDAKRKDIKRISAIKGVKTVTEVKSYKPDMEYAKKLTQATETWQDYGYKGEGMVVSIIDTGIDYTHKDLKNIDTSKIKITKSEVEAEVDKLNYGSYFTDKVPFGYNYADGNNDVIDSTGNEHGMHVAGIVAANGDDEGLSTLDAVKGVAPEAQLLAMKVFTNDPNEGSAYDDDIIAAIEDSVKLGADVINMSLGSDCGFTDPDDPENIAVEKATQAGTLCVISAGNEGLSTSGNSSSIPQSYVDLRDNATVGSPSTAANCISVASAENTIKVLKDVSYESEDGSVKKNVPYKVVEGGKFNDLSSYKEVVDCGVGDTNDFSKDIRGKVTLIKRGGLTFQEKYENAVSRGAAGVIIYNKDGDDSLVSMQITLKKKVPIFFISNSSGVELINNINKGIVNYKFENKEIVETVENENTKDMSDFTSWGPTPTLDFKPEIAAPGGEIYSLANGNLYQSMSGTSMAAPHTAGAEALILQGIKAKDLGIAEKDLVLFAKNVAMNTARPIMDKYNDDETIPFSPRRQGAGLIQIEDAIKNNVIITGEDGKAAVALKEVGNTKKFTLQLKNYGNTDVTYKLNTEKVYGEETDEYGVISEVVLNGAKVTINKDEVKVPARSTAKVECEIDINSDVDSQRYVEGFVNFTSTDTEVPSLSVPFMGFYGDWSLENIVDTPNYEGSVDTQLYETGLGQVSDNDFLYYGSKLVDGTIVINTNKVSFSPNSDDVQDYVLPKLYLLRNAKNLRFQVLDSNKNVVRDLWSQDNVRKSTLSQGVGKEFGNAKWDGTLYDASTGKYKVAEDGQYYIRIISKTELEGAREQNLDLPVKIDNKAPIVEIQNIENVTDSIATLKWTATDNNENASGVSMQATVAVNGEIIKLYEEDINESNGVYTAKIPFVENEVNSIQLAVIDNAGNTAIADKKVKAENLKTLAVSGVSDDMVVGISDLEDGKFKISGTAGSNVAKVLVNNIEVELKDNYFSGLVEVKEGENKLEVKALDKDNKVIENKNYYLFVDTKSPELEITPNAGDKKPYYTTEEDEVNFNIEVKDSTKCSVFLVKEKDIKEVELAEDGTGSFKMELDEGLNSVKLVIYDEANNETVRKINVVKSDKNDFVVGIDNLESTNYLSSKSTKDDVFTVKGFVSNKNVSLFKIAGQEVKINDDLTFEVPITLKQGVNKILIEAIDLKGKQVCNYAYKVYYDSINPEMSLETPVVREDGNIYVNTDKFDLKGYVKDNFEGYTLLINGDIVLNLDKFPMQNELKKEFSKTINLNNGLNEVELELYDSIGNKTTENLKVVLDKEAPNAPEIKLIDTESNYGEFEVNSDEKQMDKIEYSFDGENYFTYTGRVKVKDSTDVYARVTDYAGNVSDVAKNTIKVDNEAPKVSIDGVKDGENYYSKVIPKINLDDEEAKVTSLLNGKEYTGEVIDVEGDYVLEVYAVDKVGNKSKTVKKSFKVIQNSFETVEGDKHIITINDVHSAGENNLYNASVDNNIEVKITDKARGANIVSPKIQTVIPKTILNMNEGDISYVQKVHDENIEGINSINKVFELSLFSADEKEIKDFNNEKIQVSIKLTKEERDSLGKGTKLAYCYDEVLNKWVEIEGEYFDNSGVFTFKVSHLSKFTIGSVKADLSEKVDADNTNSINNTSDINKVTTPKNSSISGRTGDDNFVVVGIIILCLIAAGLVNIRCIRAKKE